MNQRGAVYVEMLVMIPVLCAVWLGGIMAFEVSFDSVTALHQRRTCGWQHAMGGCQQAPGCAGGGGPQAKPLPAVETALATLRIVLPFLAEPLTDALPGPSSQVKVEGAAGAFAMLCDPLPLPEITTETVFEEACPQLGGYCP